MTRMRELISIKVKWSLMQSTLLNLIFIQKIKIEVRDWCRPLLDAYTSENTTCHQHYMYNIREQHL